MTTIYVLHGSCGEYSDRTDWQVAAFTKKADADALSIKCIDWEATHGKALRTEWEESQDEWMDRECWDADDILGHPECPFPPCPDPLYQSSYTGTSYWVTELPLDPSPEELKRPAKGLRSGG